MREANKSKILIFLVVLFFISFISIKTANAQTLIIEHEAVKGDVLPNESAVFDIIIENKGGSSEEVQFKFQSPFTLLDWELKANPSTLKIFPRSTATSTLTLAPLFDLPSKTYGILLLIYSPTNEDIKLQHLVTINLVDYINLLKTKFVLPNAIDSRKDAIIKLDLENKYNILLENLNVKIYTDFFETERTINLNPYEKRTETFIVKFKEEVEAGEYPLNLLIKKDENVVTDFTDTMRIGLRSDIREAEDKKSGFLISRITLTRTNEGNEVSSETYSLELSPLRKLFTYSKPSPTTVIKGAETYTLIWNFDIAPGESQTIIATTNYVIPVVLLIVLAVILYLIITLTKKDLVVDKKVTTITNKDESLIRVTLNLYNKSNKEIYDVKVMDTLFKLVENPQEFGTMEPKHIRKTLSNATQLIWIIPSIKPEHEVILHYKAKARGLHKIPSVLVKYRIDGKIRLIKSEAVNIGS